MRNSLSNQLMPRSLKHGSAIEAEHLQRNLRFRTMHSEGASPDSPTHQEIIVQCESRPISPVEETVKSSTDKKSSPVRWGYLVPRFILLTIFWAMLTFGLDPMLRFGFSTGAGATLGTTVGIDKVQADLFAPSLKIERIQIADRDNPKKNALEVDQIAITLDRNAFLRKKFVADQVVISGVNWNSDSTLVISDKKNEQKQDSRWAFPFRLGAKKLAGAATQSGTQLFEELLTQAVSPYDPRDLETIQLTKIKDEQWQSRFDLYRNSADEYKQRIEKLKKQIDRSKKGNPLDNINQYAQIANEVDALIAQGKQLKREFTQLGNIARNDMAELDAARVRDYNKLREQIASLPVNAEQLTQTILGPETRRQFAEIAQWIQFVQKMMNVASQDYKPERTYGRTISFNHSDRLPSFLIREFRLSGVATSNTQPVPFTGLMKNITHAPKQFGKPMQYEMKISHQGGVHLRGVVDLTGDVPVFTLNGKIESFEFPIQKLADHEQLQFSLVTGKMQGLIQLKLLGDKIDATLSWNQSDLNFLVDGNMQLEQRELTKLGFSPVSAVDLLKRSVEGINGIHGEVSMSGSLKSPAIELRSDIGKIIANRLQDEFRKEALLRRDEARLLAEQQIDQQMQKLTTKIEQEYKTVLAELNVNENLAKNLVEKVAIRPASGILNRLFR